MCPKCGKIFTTWNSDTNIASVVAEIKKSTLHSSSKLILPEIIV